MHTHFTGHPVRWGSKDRQSDYMCVCVPVGLVVSVDSSEALAPSDGSGGEASDWTSSQRHGGESSGRPPCKEPRRRAINTLLTCMFYCHPSHTSDGTDTIFETI